MSCLCRLSEMWSSRDADTPVKLPNTGSGGGGDEDVASVPNDAADDAEDMAAVLDDDEMLKAMKVLPGDHCRT